MTTLDPKQGYVTLINTFRVKPGKADELVRFLAEATEKAIGETPGFISANFHVSLDGTRVVNYAQWRSQADFERMRSSEEFKKHTAAAEAMIEDFEPVLYELRYSHAKQREEALA